MRKKEGALFLGHCSAAPSTRATRRARWLSRAEAAVVANQQETATTSRHCQHSAAERKQQAAARRVSSNHESNSRAKQAGCFFLCLAHGRLTIVPLPYSWFYRVG